ncbi:efflux RND transporter permease subunit [Hydrogenophilus islandicus]
MAFPNLSSLAVRERAVTLFFLVLALLGGAFAFLQLGRAEDPAFTVRVLMVSAVWPGATAEEVEEQITKRLEKRLQEVPNLYRLDATVRPGRTDIKVEFHDYVPERELAQHFYEVRKRMWDEARSLPAGAIGPIVNDDFSDVYFALLALTGPSKTHRELVAIGEAIRDRLNRLPGVHKAQILGERPQTVYLEFDWPRLQRLGVTPLQVMQAVSAYNQVGPAGFVETEAARLYLRLPEANLEALERLASLPLKIGDRVLPLGEVARIRLTEEDPPSYLVRSRGDDALLLGVVMQRGANGLALGQALEAFLAAEQQRLPEGVALTLLTNQAEAISAAVDRFQLKFFMAVGVVTLVTLAALGWRAGVVTAIAIPLTLGVVFMIMLARGISLDRVSLGALILALGLLVDDAIIVIEMMVVKLEEGWGRAHAATHAWHATAAPMLFGTLVTAAGFLPIGFAKSGVGEYAGNIFWVLAFALIVSWFVAVLFTPYLGFNLLPHYQKVEGGIDALYATPGYQRLRRLIQGCVRYRKSVVAVTVAILILAGVGMAKGVAKQFFPSSDRPEVLVDIQMPAGTSIAKTDEVTRRIEALLAPLPEVRSMMAHVGRGAPRFFISASPEPPDTAFAKIVAVARNVEARERVIAVLEEAVRRGDFAEARVRVHRLLYGPPVPWPVELRVMGPDLNEVRRISHEVRAVMAQNPHVVDPHLAYDERTPVVTLHFLPERLASYGLTPLDVKQQLQLALSGVPVTELRRGDRTVQLIARGGNGWLADPSALETIEIRTASGERVPLLAVVRWEVTFEDQVIKRYNRERYITVQSEVVGAQPPDVTRAIWAAIAPIRDVLPPGYHIEIGGTVEASGKADASIQKLQPVMVAVMLIFIMLQMREFAGTFMTVATAPLGLIGATAALLITQKPFGFIALLGLIGLAGILMRNTLILTQQVRDFQEQGWAAAEAVVEAAVRRARPVVLTALAAALAFLPLATDTFWGPLAIVLIGGVVVGTAITLLFVPALYALWYRLPHTLGV